MHSTDREFELTLLLARSLGTLKGIYMTESNMPRKISLIECYLDLVRKSDFPQKKDWISWAESELTKTRSQFINQ